MAPVPPRVTSCERPAGGGQHTHGIDFRYLSARYEIVVENPNGVSRGVATAELDGRWLAGAGTAVPLVDDGATHRFRVILG